MYENILFEKKDGVAYLTLNRPDRLNALNGAVLKELDDALAAIDGDAEIRVLVVRGAGEKALAAGADITEMQSMEAEAGMAFGAFGQKVFAKIEALRQPSIAMIPGFALGGGCELALACDIRIASEKARFGQPEVGLGITAGFGGTQRLPRLIGPSRAKLLMMTGNHSKGEAALAMGLVDMVFPAEELLEAAVNMAKEMAAKPPLALEYVKWAVNEGMQMDLDRALLFESALFAHLYSTEDQKEAMSAFLEKRPTRPFQGK